MIPRHIGAAFAALALAMLPATVHAKNEAESKGHSASADYEANSASRSFTGTFGGRRVRYSATVEEQVLKDDKGTPKAAIVTTAYVAEPRDTNRPVTFLFNGGPGSASLWLQMGAFGPMRVAIPSDARDDGSPPYPILDNPDSLLDVTDLVFIDPVGTGFSHAIGDTDPKDYWGVTKDAKSVAQVIRKWLSENGRWNSPKYLGGESYGTTRSAAVVKELEGSYNDVALNGVILISTVLDFGAGAETEGNELGYITTLPSMAVTALYHGKAQGSSPAAFAQEAREFALGPYAAFLLKGQMASQAERDAIRPQLARFTGLSERFLELADMRVSSARFYKELLRDRGLTVGRLDGRYTGRDYDNAGEGPDNDPSFYGIDAGYTAAANSYLRDTVGYDTERNYVTIGGVSDWDWRLAGGRDFNAYLTVAPYLGRAMRENSGLRLFVAQGWYDFATPFFAAEYALTRTGIPQDRVQFEYYDSGHMMYVRNEDRRKLSEDVRAFIRGR
ncbi:peptidase S10 [Altererythrobacter arenosus]|uniref:Peptidase S10 n=1 Tax=Altererythrobacter arenosus TaxID=3032592 RepID=A0ABY8FN49_9SPHN|nr:peptidase S10 [Altererythrobacter sp. CAU 1644]WFL76449.1 peptidase S10 [Altererythrobacter sp. CAU 1644]